MQTMRTSPCTRCGRQIGWVITDTGRRMPIDPEPDPTGNVICNYEAGVLRGHVLTKGEPRPSGVAFLPHFATCGVTKKAAPATAPAPEPVQADLFQGDNHD